MTPTEPVRGRFAGNRSQKNTGWQLTCSSHRITPAAQTQQNSTRTQHPLSSRHDFCMSEAGIKKKGEAREAGQWGLEVYFAQEALIRISRVVSERRDLVVLIQDHLGFSSCPSFCANREGRSDRGACKPIS